MKNSPFVTAILLAAGNASRMGQAKQLLMIHHQPLVALLADQFLISNIDALVVVTGAFNEEVSNALKGKNLDLVYNDHWKEGMGSSLAISAGFALTKYPQSTALLIGLADQPNVNYTILNTIIKKHKDEGAQLINCSDNHSSGPPVLMGISYFDKLRALKGDTGAKSIIASDMSSLTTIHFPDVLFDLDTPHDYQLWKNNSLNTK